MKNNNIKIFHNILWSKYKGVVFEKLNLMLDGDDHIKFIQIAETDFNRSSLSGIDMSYHKYPYKLMFSGSYGDVSKIRLIFSLIIEVARSTEKLIILPGYHKVEYWMMLLTCVFMSKKRAVFCDSTIYDQKPSLLKNIAKRIFFSLCDGYFGYGIRSREYLQHHGAQSSRIYYRCQAAALPHDYSILNARNARLMQARHAPNPRYLYVGRLSPEKGLDTLLTAFKTVITKYAQAELVIVGSGPMQSELFDMVKEFDVAANVTFMGGLPIEAIVQEYAKATCLVLPSRSEPWGLVVNEALSYGCPVVVSYVCGCVPELVKDGITGYSYLNDDAEQLAERMLRITVEFSNTAQVADRCLQLISEYSPEHAAQQILIGCQEILNAP